MMLLPCQGLDNSWPVTEAGFDSKQADSELRVRSWVLSPSYGLCYWTFHILSHYDIILMVHRRVSRSTKVNLLTQQANSRAAIQTQMIQRLFTKPLTATKWTYSNESERPSFLSQAWLFLRWVVKDDGKFMRQRKERWISRPNRAYTCTIAKLQFGT